MSCLLCDNQTAVILPQPESDSLWVKGCQVCEDYRLVGTGLHLEGELRQTRHLMAGLMAERKIRHEGPMEIRRSSWMDIVATAPQTFTAQVDRFLVNLSKKSSEGGVMTSLSTDIHLPWAYAASKDSFTMRLQTLEEDGYIRKQGGRDQGSTPSHRGVNDMGFMLTYKGWKRAEELEQTGVQSDQAFIALTRNPKKETQPDPRMTAIVTAIKRAIAEAGYRPIFMEDLNHGDKIDDRVLVEIRRSKFMVADTTGRNENVTFEAGFALALGRTGLWTCREGDHQDQAFDIRQYKRML